jgi:hypothetical protein
MISSGSKVILLLFDFCGYSDTPTNRISLLSPILRNLSNCLYRTTNWNILVYFVFFGEKINFGKRGEIK